jgi:adhesin transport system membrane fusion protein
MAQTDFNQLSKELSGKGGIGGSLLLLIIIMLVGIALFWANLTELDNVTRGQGKIISSMKNQMVQASEGGVFKASYVKEGQKVDPGELMFEIDPIDAKTSLDQASQRLASLQIQQARLSAEITETEPEFSLELSQLAPTVVAIEKALFVARRADLSAQMAVLQQQLNQRNLQLSEINVTVKTSEDTLKLVEDQIAIIKPLVKAGQYPETDLISLLRQATEFIGKSSGAKASLNRVNSSIAEVQDKIDAAKQSYIAKSQAELAKIISQIAEVNSRLPALKDRVNRTQVRSPVKGIINRVNFRTIGGFVQPGDVIAELVPIGDDLIVEGNIDPKDIAYINPGQDVRISLTAYDASRYGTIDGKVLKVSADAVQDRSSGASAYIVNVSIDGELVEDDGSVVEIMPGMVASIDVLAGKRTVLEYLWQPMAKIKERAFTD